MAKEYISLLTKEQRDEFNHLFQRRNCGRQGGPLSPSEELRYDELLTIQAEEDFANYGATIYPGISKEEIIPHLKAKFVSDNII